MVTNRLNLVVDADVLNSFKIKVGKGNITKTITEYMKNYATSNDGDIDQIEELQIRKALIANEKIKIDAEYQKISNQLEKININVKHTRLKEIQQKKETQEDKNRCFNCGNFINDKFHDFTKGKVCHSCFMADGSKKIAEWCKK